MDSEEAAWHREADRVFTALLTEAEAGRREPGLEREAADWLVSLGLRCDHREYVEAWCLRLGRDLPPSHSILGLAALCIGHLARRFGYVSNAARSLVEELAARCRRDPTDVDGRALSGLEDVRWHAPRWPLLANLTRCPRRLWNRVRGAFDRT